MSDIIISVVCDAYNHEAYIAQCLDGFIMQKTDFIFEVLIHDDASTDNTANIIRKYAEKYPDIIKPIYQEKNQYSKRTGIWRTFQFPRAQGKYIALCEGDDYWTDPLKLQKQVDFLEKNEKYALCFHNATEHYEDKSQADKYFSSVENRDYSGTEIYHRWTIPTASVVFRSNIIKNENYIKKLSNPNFLYTDTPLFLLCAENGKLRGMKDCMSVYRRHSGGISLQNPQAKDYIKLCYHHYTIGQSFNKEIQRISKSLYIHCGLIFCKNYLFSVEFTCAFSFLKFLFTHFSFFGLYDLRKKINRLGYKE